MEALSALALAVLALAGGRGQDAAREAWQRAAALPAGDPARAAAVLEALAARQGPLDDASLRLAWETGVAAASELRLGEAVGIQQELAERHPEPWSAMDLALSLGRAGRTAEADLVLERALERVSRAEGAGLWERRGLLWLGAGDERRARDCLGRALARGSGDAAVVLAWLDLERGRSAQARAGFRPGLYDDPPGAWALRGWGLSLLPIDPRPALAPANREESDR